MRVPAMTLAALLVCAGAARAQAQDPIGPFVVDVRGVMGGLPTTEGWTPLVPEGTPVPSRGLGLDAGAHVYLRKTGPVTFGVGADYAVVRSRSQPLVETAPEVTTRVTTLAPQVSFNFGHRLGWSYLSVGYGWGSVRSEAAALPGVPAAEEDSGSGSALNFGGGARWFITEHVGVGFDARWHRLSARTATASALAAPRATLFNIAVGVSIR